MEKSRQHLMAILVLSALLLSACSPVTEAPAPSSDKKVMNVTVAGPGEGQSVVAPAGETVVIETKERSTAVAARKTVAKRGGSTRKAHPVPASVGAAAQPAGESIEAETAAEPVATTVPESAPEQAPATPAAVSGDSGSAFFPVLLTFTLFGLLFSAPFYAGPLHRRITAYIS